MAALLTLSDTRTPEPEQYHPMLARAWRAWIPHTLRVGVQSGTAALGNNLTASVKMKSNQHMTLPLMPGNSSERKASSRLHRVLNTSLLAAWFVRILDWKEPRHPLVSKRPKAIESWCLVKTRLNSSQAEWKLCLLKQASCTCCIPQDRTGCG